MSDTLSQARLDSLWDFGDAAASEQRLREAVAAESSPSIASELTTQVARALGLQQSFDEADELLDAVPDPDGVVAVRVLLERGRLRNSAARSAEAIPLFEAALLIATAEGLDFLAIDAAHMLAIADRDRIDHWTARALQTVDGSSDARTRRWAVSLRNNLGWFRFEGGDLAGALVEFELAADAAREFGTEEQRGWAQEAIDQTLEAIRKKS
jgi:hypothetical protein